jgi:hypothetical protein
MDSVKGLVPEIYYDMIARVGAGVPLVAIFFSPSLDELQRISNAVSFILLIGLGYIAGHLLPTVSVVLNLMFWNPWVIRRFQVWFGLGLEYKFTSFSTMRVFDVIYQRIDWAANKDANAGAIMKKMEAGAALSDNLLSGWLVILSYQAFGGIRRWPVGLQWNCSIIALVTFVLVASVYIRRWALIIRQDRLLELLGYPKEIK